MAAWHVLPVRNSSRTRHQPAVLGLKKRTRNSEKVLADYHFESKLLFQNQYFPFVSFYYNLINLQVS